MIVAKYVLSLSILLLMVGACKSHKEGAAANDKKVSGLDFSAGPPAMVYKTRADYRDKVAILLSKDRKGIVAYPHPKDIAARLSQVKPTVLENGYLLDNQGINQWVAFTSYTFAEYAALEEAPGLKELEAKIIDKDPLLEICYCGNRRQFSDITAGMNQLIAENLQACEKLNADGK